MPYYARLCEQDVAGVGYAYKTITAKTSGTVTLTGKIRSDVGGQLYLQDSYANAGTTTGIIRLGLDAGTGTFTLSYWDGTAVQTVDSGIPFTPGEWYIVELTFDITNGSASGVIKDINGNVIWTSPSVTPSLTQVEVIGVTGVGYAKTGCVDVDDILVTDETSTTLLQDDFDDGDVSDWIVVNGTFEAVLLVWEIQYRGRLLKLKPGETGTAVFTINPNGVADTISITCTTTDGLDVVCPTSVSISGTTPVTINVDVSVPSSKKIDSPVWIVYVTFAGSTKTDTGAIGVIPISTYKEKILLTPPGSGEGYWIGAPSIAKSGNGYYYMTVRDRDPVSRGKNVYLYKFRDPRYIGLVKQWDTDALGYVSTERNSIAELLDGSAIMLESVDSGTGFYIKKTTAPTIEQVELNGTQITLDSTNTTEKDAYIYYDQDKGVYVIGISANDGTVPKTEILETTDFTTFTPKIRLDFKNDWSSGAGAHIGWIGKKGTDYIIIYDATTAPDNTTYDWYEGKMGIALVKDDYSDVIDLTPDQPVFGLTDVFRYVMPVIYGDQLFLFGEIDLGDGSHALAIRYSGDPIIPQPPSGGSSLFWLILFIILLILGALTAEEQ